MALDQKEQGHGEVSKDSEQAFVPAQQGLATVQRRWNGTWRPDMGETDGWTASNTAA